MNITSKYKIIRRLIGAVAMESSSVSSLSSFKEEDKCLICNKTFRRKGKIHCFGVTGWSKLKEQAEKRSKLKIHKDNNEYVYTLVNSKLNGTEEHVEKSHTLEFRMIGGVGIIGGRGIDIVIIINNRGVGQG